MGKEFVANIQDTIQKGLIWKRLTEENGKEEETRGKEARRRRQGEKKQNEQGEKQAQSTRATAPKTAAEPEGAAGEEVQPTTLTQEVYKEGVRNWAAQASLQRFFGSGGVRENCNEIATDSILHSDVEKQLDELLEDKPTREESNTSWQKLTEVTTFKTAKHKGFLQPVYNTAQLARGYHTMKRENLRREENKRRYTEDSQKMLVPVRQPKNNLELMVRNKNRKYPAVPNRLRNNQYKNLKAAAKQKFRSFNVQKKFTPSASVLLLLDKKKKERAGKNLEIITAENKQKKTEEEKTEEEAEEKEESEEAEKSDENEEGSNEKQLIVRKEQDRQDRYRDFIFKQLRDLRRENEELKKKLSKLNEDKRMESNLQSQSDTLELERTKLKACWLIMSSTMDAFSNFCKKFTSKSEEQLLDAARELRKQQEEEEEEREAEEFDDALESLEEQTEENDSKTKEKKNPRYDEKYFKFLQKLMEDQIETQLDEKRNRVRK